MKRLTRTNMLVLTVLIAFGAILFGFGLKYWGMMPSCKDGVVGARFLIALGVGLYFIAGTMASLLDFSAIWKRLKALSLLPFFITLAFSWLSLFAPRLIYPPRDTRFFKEHVVEYRNSIVAFAGSTTYSRIGGRHKLPASFRSLSEDGLVEVITREGRINYYYLYQRGFNSYEGVVYAPDGRLIVNYGFTRPLGEAGWFYAGYY